MGASPSHEDDDGVTGGDDPEEDTDDDGMLKMHNPSVVRFRVSCVYTVC